MQLTEVNDAATWDALVTASPFGHPLQLWAWGELKARNGWQARHVQSAAGAAQILLWPIPKTTFKLAYIPRGPIIDPASPQLANLLAALGDYAKAQGAIFVSIEPAWKQATLPQSWQRTSDETLMRQTYVIDLSQPAENVEAGFATKARQYARKAERQGVQVRAVTDPAEIAKVLAVYHDTATRAKFGLHADAYYQQLFEAAGEYNHLFVAEANGTMVAFVWLLGASDTAFELYGGMTAEGAKLRANYALKYHAIVAMREHGYRHYDFNGRLNEGVSYFKGLWGAAETDWVGTYRLKLRQPHAALWQVLWPLGKRLAKLVGSR